MFLLSSYIRIAPYLDRLASIARMILFDTSPGPHVSTFNTNQAPLKTGTLSISKSMKLQEVSPFVKKISQSVPQWVAERNCTKQSVDTPRVRTGGIGLIQQNPL